MAKKTIILDDYDKSNKKKGGSLSSKHVKIIIAAILILAVVAYGVYYFVDQSNNYIVTVDGIKISVNDFNSELSNVTAKYLEDAKVDKEDPVAVEKFWSSKNEAGVGNRLAAKQEALKKVVERAVQLRVAKDKDIVLNQIDTTNLIKEAETNAENYAAQYSSYSSKTYTPEKFVEEYYKVSYAEYKRLYLESYIINQLMNMEKAKMEPTEAEMKAWYEKDKDKYDLYVVDAIYISYQGKDADDKAVMLKDDKLAEAKKKVTDIDKALTEQTETFKDLAKKYATSDYKAEYQLKKTDGKVAMTNTSADMEDVNKELNDSLKSGSSWIKKEVKGVSSGNFKDEVVGVYFLKYDTTIGYDTADREEADTIKSTIKTEVLTDLYEKQVEDWAKDARFEVKYNKDIYKNYTVAGLKAE